ncbi:MAG: SAM-dependent methyltransferase [Limibaculum sp.]
MRARPHCVKGHRITSGDAGVAPVALVGIYVARVLHGGTDDDLLALLKRRFAKAQNFKPLANRKDSAEMLVVTTGFRGE